MKYNVLILDFELRKAGLPIDGVDSDGNISWAIDPSSEQTKKANEILSNHNPNTVKEVISSPLKDLAKSIVVKDSDGEYDFSIAEDINNLFTKSKISGWFQAVLNVQNGSFDKELIEMLEDRIAIEIGEGTLKQESANLLAAALFKVKKGLV